MTKTEFNTWRSNYNLTPEQAAKVLGTSRANAFKYANGSRPISKPVAFQCEVIDLLTIKKSLKLIQKRLT